MNLLRKSSMTLLGAVAAGLLAFACADSDGVAADSSEINGNAPVERATTLVISAVYGGGGGGADETGDFVELFNPTKEAIDLAAYSLQTQPKGKPGFNKDKFSTLKGKVEPGHYFLLGLGKTDKKYGPDAKDADLVLTGHDQDLITTAGGVALVKGDKLCAGVGQCEDTTDLVGYGQFNADVAPMHTGEVAAAAKTKADSVVRIKSGCVDSANNKADFEVAPVSPRTSADSADCDKILAPVAQESDAGTDAAPTPETDAGGDAAVDEPTEPSNDGGADSGPKPSKPDASTGGGSGGGDADEDEEDQPKDLTPEPTGGKKKKSSANAPPQPIAASSPSCSTTSGPASSGSLAGLAGLGLALAALGRRRKS